MTTIAYKDGVLAFDSKITQGSVNIGTTTKGKKNDEYLVAYSGDLDYGQAFMRWVLSGFSVALKPPRVDPHEDRGMDAIVIDRKGSIRHYDSNLLPTTFKGTGNGYALGSGADFANGAMAYGASAKEAVKIAGKFDVHTGGPVRTLSFNPPKKKKVKSE